MVSISPWAMLMTPISPKVMARPSAANRNTLARRQAVEQVRRRCSTSRSRLLDRGQRRRGRRAHAPGPARRTAVGRFGRAAPRARRLASPAPAEDAPAPASCGRRGRRCCEVDCGPGARAQRVLRPRRRSRGASALRSSGSTASPPPLRPAPAAAARRTAGSGARSCSCAITGQDRPGGSRCSSRPSRSGRGAGETAAPVSGCDQGSLSSPRRRRPRRRAPPAGGRRRAPPAPAGRAASPRSPSATMALLRPPRRRPAPRPAQQRLELGERPASGPRPPATRSATASAAEKRRRPRD